MRARRRRGPQRGTRVGVALAFDAKQELGAYQKSLDGALDSSLEIPRLAPCRA